MSAENVRREAGLLADEPSHVSDAFVEAAGLEAAVLDSLAETPDDGPAGTAAVPDQTVPDETVTEPDDADSADSDSDASDADAEADAEDNAAAPPAVAPPTGTMSAERIALKALEQRLLGGERKLRRREVASGAGLSLLSARKLWRALGFPNIDDEDVAFTERDQAALTPSWTWSAPASSPRKPRSPSPGPSAR